MEASREDLGDGQTGRRLRVEDQGEARQQLDRDGRRELPSQSVRRDRCRRGAALARLERSFGGGGGEHRHGGGGDGDPLGAGHGRGPRHFGEAGRVGRQRRGGGAARGGGGEG